MNKLIYFLLYKVFSCSAHHLSKSSVNTPGYSIVETCFFNSNALPIMEPMSSLHEFFFVVGTFKIKGQQLISDVIDAALESGYRSIGKPDPYRHLCPRTTKVTTLNIDDNLELSLFGIYNTMTIYNIVDCVPRVHHV